jgi:SM-20-related protein
MSAVIFEPAPFKAIVDALARDGWCTAPGFLARNLAGQLFDESVRLRQDGGFRPAAVGQGAHRLLEPDLRSDLIRWLEAPFTPAQQEYLQRMEQLRQALNAALYLGLFDYECHLSIYPPGARYRRHLDQFRRDSRRTVSCVTYLNDEWLPEHGGQLRLYGANKDEAAFHDIFPIGGTLVCFLSSRIPHEVMPATRERFSLTGWFRVRE